MIDHHPVVGAALTRQRGLGGPVASGAPDLVVVGVGRGTAVSSVRGLVIIEVGRGGTAASASWDLVVNDVGRVGYGRGHGGMAARCERPRRH